MPHLCKGIVPCLWVCKQSKCLGASGFYVCVSCPGMHVCPYGCPPSVCSLALPFTLMTDSTGSARMTTLDGRKSLVASLDAYDRRGALMTLQAGCALATTLKQLDMYRLANFFMSQPALMSSNIRLLQQC
eukprot:1159190-Pelagomonas_calceolata.AAC.6